MKILILVVLFILVAPTVAKRFSPKEEKGAPARDGLLYRLVRRFGVRAVAAAFVVALIGLSLLLYVLAHRS